MERNEDLGDRKQGIQKASLRKGHSGKVLKKGKKGACRSLGANNPGKALRQECPYREEARVAGVGGQEGERGPCRPL